ncbi:hypothetical protein RUND412_003257 [Rhizina undulata]
MSPAPALSVAILGATGFIGREITPIFLSALRSHEIACLNILTRNATGIAFEAFKAKGARIYEVDFYNKDSVVEGLKGVDVLISAMGTKGDFEDSNQVLVEAAAEAGVKVYLPSEWGTDHRWTKFKHPIFDIKQRHQEYAEQLGLKIVAIYPALIMETTFCKYFGFDSANLTWKIIGAGDIPLAMTSQKDLGLATLATVFLAHRSPQICPSYLRIYSDNRTLNQYADIMEKASGKKIKRIYITPEDALKESAATKENNPQNTNEPLVPLMMSEGLYDYSQHNGNDIINPGDRYFKWKTASDYAREVGGMPWENMNPWG